MEIGGTTINKQLLESERPRAGPIDHIMQRMASSRPQNSNENKSTGTHARPNHGPRPHQHFRTRRSKRHRVIFGGDPTQGITGQLEQLLEDGGCGFEGACICVGEVEELLRRVGGPESLTPTFCARTHSADPRVRCRAGGGDLPPPPSPLRRRRRRSRRRRERERKKRDTHSTVRECTDEHKERDS